MFKNITLLLLCSSFFLVQKIDVFAQPANKTIVLPSISSSDKNWVDSVFNMLTLEEKIAQLFMVAAYSGTEKYNADAIEKLIKENKIGGLIFMQGTPTAQAELTNKFQQLSKVPIWIGMDAEWGLGMRLKGVKDFPKQMMLGAMEDSTLVTKMANAIAYQCKRMGVQIDFAPVIDVNNNPNNPVINFRSFGEQREHVANLGTLYMRGLQNNGIIACAKHFPGHGDTDVDSHKDLPEITKSFSELEKLELYPFKHLIADGIQSMMIAHLQIPALDNTANTPTTLSSKVVTDLLKNKLGFSGLIFTDALNMKGVTKHYSPGEVDLKAFLAGNDVLLFSENVPLGIEKIKEAIENKKISMARLEESVKKILLAKYNSGLSNFKNIETKNIDEDLNQYTSILKSQIAQEAITLLQDPNAVIDKIKKSKTKKIAYVSVGKTDNTVFGEMLKNELDAEFFSLNQTNVDANNSTFQKLKNYDGVIIGIHNLALYPKDNYGLDKIETDIIKKLNANKNTVLVNFGNPYVLKNLCDENCAILVCYDEADETQKAASKLLSGNAVFKGKLPVSICNKFKVGDGIASNQSVLGEKNIPRVVKVDKYPSDVNDIKNVNNGLGKSVTLTCCVSPNALGASLTELDKLDNLVENAIKQGAFPGCRVLAAKNGQVFYDKAFGFLDYGKKNPVDNNTVYDLASVTKAAATTIAVMKLVEEGKINLDKTLGDYLSFTKGSNKQFLKIKDVLLHQAGLKAWIPFYKETLDSTSYPNKIIYSTKKSTSYPNKVCSNLYMSKNWEDTMWKRILLSEIAPRGNYVYSDLDFIFLQKVVEQVSKTSLDKYVKKEFYDNLKMQNTMFNPKDNLKGKKIAPSEYDNYFRHQEINGFVHDMGAAMFGGVSGHAGLFSTAGDLAILFQMLNNGGIYEGKRYLKKSTIDLFTSKYSFTSRRALGFDKPEPNKSKSQPTSSNCSLKTYGHTGFTGTCIWADPENDIIFIFLSNRTYPSADNKLIQRMDIREKAQQYVYNAFGISSR